jgi:hypothetical protein
MVGGEQCDNEEMRERRKNRQLLADERKERLMGRYFSNQI